MKVYVLNSGYLESRHVAGVFSSREKAEQAKDERALDKNYEDDDIEEFELDLKVYVLESGSYMEGGHEIKGVFSTSEKAGQANEILDIAGTITEIELDEIEIRAKAEPWEQIRYERVKI